MGGAFVAGRDVLVKLLLVREMKLSKLFMRRVRNRDLAPRWPRLAKLAGWVAGMGLAATVGLAQPANDNFANAEAISGASGTVSGDSTGATLEAGEPAHNCVNPDPGGSSVWYQWIAPADGTIIFDTVGSGFDTVMAAYTGTDVTALTVVACDDDSAGNFLSRISFSATTGTVYYIVVDGYFGSQGLVTLNWRSGETVPLEAGTFQFTRPRYFVSENESFAAPTPPIQMTAPGPLASITRVLGSTGRMLVNYRITNAFYQQIVVTNFFGTNIYTTNFDEGTGLPTDFNIAVATNIAVTIPHLDVDGQGNFSFCLEQFANQISGTNANGLLILTNSPIDFPTNFVCLEGVSISNAPPTNIVVTELFCTNVFVTNLVPTALPFQDYIPQAGQLVFEDYQMRADIPILVFPRNPTPRLNRTIVAIIDSVIPDPLESPDIVAPQVNPARASALMHILDTDVVPNECGTNAGIIVNFTHKTIEAPEDVGEAIVYVRRSGTNGTTSGSVRYRIDWTPQGESSLNTFTLSDGSDYAIADDCILTYAQTTPDYTNTSHGTLNWGANDFNLKGIPIPITDDTRVEFNEDIFITLYEPSGVEIGYINSCNLTVLFDNQLGGEQPAGAADRTHNRHDAAETSPPFNQRPGANGTVFALAVQSDDKTVVAGNFTAFNTTPRNRIARMNVNGQLDTAFNPGSGANDFISALALQSDGRIVAAGAFNSFNGTQRPRIVRLNSNGSLDNAFNPGFGANATVWAVAVQPDGKIIIGGEFTMADVFTRKYIARLNTDGTVDTTFDPGIGPNGAIYGLALQPNGAIVIGGEFTTVAGVSRPRVARLNPDGTLDPTFDPAVGADDTIYAVALQGGRVWIGGAFNNFNLISRKSIARLNANGSLDTTFDPGVGANDTVYSIVPQNDGRVLIGGIFTSYNKTRRMGFARLQANGPVDTSFLDTAYNHYAGLPKSLYNPEIEPDNFVFTSGLQSDGNVMIGGGFTRVGGGFTRSDISPRQNVARLIGGGTPGPGSISLAHDQYTADENGLTGYVTLVRENGSLGPAAAVVTGTTLPAGSGAAVENADFSFNASVYGRPLWTTTWPRPTWMLSDGLTDANNNELAVDDVRRASTLNDVFFNMIDNTNIDGNRTFTVEVSAPITADVFFLGGSPSGPAAALASPLSVDGENIPLGVAIGRAAAPMTIIDDDAPPGTITFTRADYFVSEDATNAVISVIRTNGSVGLVTVQYETSAGSAAAGADYQNRSGTLSFPGGVTSNAFLVPIINDSLVEDDETVNLRLFSVTGGGRFGLTNATLTIVDNDFPSGRLNFSVTNYSVPEGAGQATITVTRTGGSKNALSVQYASSAGTATAGVDYTNVTGTLNWDANDIAPRTFSVPIVQDVFVEGNETINLSLFNPSLTGAVGSRSNAVLTIGDDDFYGTVQFSAEAISFPENGGSATITVVRTGGSSESVTVNFTTSDVEAVAGFDYSPTNGTLAFGPGEISKTFSVRLLDNPFQDGNRRLALVLTDSSPTNTLGFPQAVFLTIVDDESNNEPAGSPDTAFFAGFNGDVFTLALQPDGKILAGGDFTFAANTPRTRIARLNYDGSVDETFMKSFSGANDTVRAMIHQTDGRTLIGGFFTQVNGVNLNSIARLNDNGSLDSLFNPGSGANGPIYALEETFAADGSRRLVAGGSFVTYNGTPRNRIARINNNGTLDFSFDVGLGADATVFAVAVFPTNSLHAGKVLIGGDFTSVNGVARSRIARLNTDGSLDLSFNPFAGPNESVRTVAIQSDGRILIGGLFTNVNGFARSRIARLNADGSVDATFNPGLGANDIVQTIAVQGDTRIILGGQFTRASGVSRNRVTRLQPDGTVDPMINFGAGANAFVAAAVIQTNDMIVLAGGFTEFDGVSRPRIVRLYGGAIAGSGSLEFTRAIYPVNENATNVTVTVRRRGGTSNAPDGANITASTVTSDGTALQGLHYAGGTNALVFPQGEVFQDILIPIFDNFEINPDRVFQVALTNPLPAGVAATGDQPTATVTIINDDSAISFAAESYSVSENTGTGVAAITVIRSGSVVGDATVQFNTTTNGAATPGLDYIPVTNALVVFTNGETMKIVTIPILNDTLIEGNETITLELTNSIGAYLLSPFQATLTIVDDDFGPGRIAFASPAYTVVENAGNAIISLIRTDGSAGLVGVSYFTSNLTATAGFDYVASGGTVAFGDGETNKNIVIPILDDSFVEGNEVFLVTITNATGGATITGSSSAPVTILDNDVGITFASPVYVVNEGGGSVTLTVLRISGSNGVATVRYSTANGTALAGADFLGATNNLLTFADGETIKTITIPILEDTLVEGDEAFSVVLSNPSSGVQLLTSTATVTILDNDSGFRFAEASYFVDEHGTNALLTVIRTNPNTGIITVVFSTTNGTATAGSDFIASGGSLVFTNGESAKTIAIPIINDTQVEGPETFFVTLSSPSDGAQLLEPVTASVTIIDNDSGLRFSSANYTVTENGVEAIISVLRSGVLTNTVATSYATSDGTAVSGQDYFSVSGLLVFTNGESLKTFAVPIVDDDLEEGAETVLLTLHSPTGQVSLLNPNSAILTIVDNDGGSILPAGVLLTAESVAVNGAIDPGETVTGLFALRNLSGINTTNLVATLLPTNGVTAPSGSQNYGALADGGASASRSFTFTANGTNGAMVAATFEVQDGPINLGRVTFPFMIGSGSTVFSNVSPITIVDNNTALPYPSSISVTGLVGSISKVTVMVTNLSHGSPMDIDMLLAGPDSTSAVLMSDAGGGNFMTNVTLTFDDAAGASLPFNSAIGSGTYKPTNFGTADLFPVPAPPSPWGSTLSVFNGTNPNGLWSLFVVDDLTIFSGSISRGWRLAITTFGLIPSAADLSVGLTAAPDPVVVSSNLTFSVQITNHGPWAATGVTLSQALPAGATFVSATLSTGTFTTNNGAVIWSVGNLAMDAVATATIVVRPTVVGPNTSTVTLAGHEGDPNPLNNVASVTSTVSSLVADLAVGVVGSPDVLYLGVGGNLTFNIVVTNLGPATATGVTVTNFLPPGVTFISATPASYTVVGNVVTFTNLGTLGSGAQLAASIVVTPTVADTLTNTTACGSDLIDPLRGNNVVSVKSVVEVPQLTVTRVGNALVMSWPADATGFILERTASLTPPVVWTTVTSPPAQTAGEVRFITLPIGNGNEFFRLNVGGP